MLILSRHQDEIITIGDNIRVTVTEIRGDQVRLGIEAPEGVSIHRKEVRDSIKRSQDAGLPTKRTI